MHLRKCTVYIKYYTIRIKKVETQKKVLQMTKSLSCPENTSRWSHRQKEKFCVTDVLCVLQFLCFTLLKPMDAIPHIYRFLLGYLWLAAKHLILKSTNPRLSFIVLLHRLPPFANFCSRASLSCPDSLLSLRVSLWLTFCIQRPTRSGRSFCLVNLLYHLLITNETQKENVSVSLVGGVHAHAWPLLHLLLVLSFLSEMSLKGVKCLSSFLPASPFMRSILPLHHPAIYDATQELQGRMGREEGNLSFHLLSLHL